MRDINFRDILLIMLGFLLGLISSYFQNHLTKKREADERRFLLHKEAIECLLDAADRAMRDGQRPMLDSILKHPLYNITRKTEQAWNAWLDDFTNKEKYEAWRNSITHDLGILALFYRQRYIRPMFDEAFQWFVKHEKKRALKESRKKRRCYSPWKWIRRSIPRTKPKNAQD